MPSAADDLAKVIPQPRRELVEFLGRHFSEPKPHVRFTPPRRPLAAATFARACLQRGIALDLHPPVFAVGHFAQTALHHVPVLLERSADLRYELQVPTTWAVSVWEWLSDAVLPFGDGIAH